MDNERYGYDILASIIFIIIGYVIAFIGWYNVWPDLSKAGFFITVFLGVIPIIIIIVSEIISVILDNKTAYS